VNVSQNYGRMKISSADDVMNTNYQSAIVVGDESRLGIRQQVLERPEQVRDHRADIAQHADEHHHHNDHRHVTVDGPASTNHGRQTIDLSHRHARHAQLTCRLSSTLT